ncbi:hypothetical protein [Aquimarina sp. 2304DJ70-9]|uniref:hypothetical protein n=1 Tax=Aquimarina penaris TaxID=3231044 RepID=UPI0034636728
MSLFNIPSLPTDNLYKFYAITGLTICVITASFLGVSYIKLKDDQYAINAELALLHVEVEFAEEKSKDIVKLINKLDKEVDAFYKGQELEVNSSPSTNRYEIEVDRQVKLAVDKELREYYKFQFDYEKQLFPYKVKQAKIPELIEELDVVKKAIKLKSVEVNSKSVKLDMKRNQLISLTMLCSIIIVFGIWLSNRGFYLWKTRVQDKIDEKLKLELLALNYNEQNSEESGESDEVKSDE